MNKIYRHRKVRAGPDGIYVFDRQTGVNVLFDEIDVPQSQWAKAPRHVSIALTNACDLHCPYCYAPKQYAKLNLADLVRWVNELDDAGTVGIGFGGGEPLLFSQLADLCQYATQNTSLAVSLTTHGHHLDERLGEALKGNIHFIRVSMDGVGKTYEAFRGRSFAKLVETLNYTYEVAPFGINFVVNANTINDLDEAVEIAESTGAQELLLLPEQSVKGAGGIDNNTLHSLKSWITEYRKPLRISISATNEASFSTCDPFSKERGLRAYAHIDADGKLKRSSYDLTGISIGDGTIMGTLQQLELQERE